MGSNLSKSAVAGIVIACVLLALLSYPCSLWLLKQIKTRRDERNYRDIDDFQGMGIIGDKIREGFGMKKQWGLPTWMRYPMFEMDDLEKGDDPPDALWRKEDFGAGVGGAGAPPSRYVHADNDPSDLGRAAALRAPQAAIIQNEPVVVFPRTTSYGNAAVSASTHSHQPLPRLTLEQRRAYLAMTSKKPDDKIRPTSSRSLQERRGIEPQLVVQESRPYKKKYNVSLTGKHLIRVIPDTPQDLAPFAPERKTDECRHRLCVEPEPPKTWAMERILGLSSPRPRLVREQDLEVSSAS